MKNIKETILLLVIFICIICLTGCFDKSKEIKKGSLNACPEYTIEELVNNYLQNPKWNVEKSDKGYYVYNVTGKAYYKDELSNLLIQFAEDGDDIVVKSFEINKVDQNVLTFAVLINEMCNETEKNLKRESSNLVNDEYVTRQLAEIGEDWYKKYYYSHVGTSVQSYEKTGIKVTLSTLMNGYQEYYEKIKHLSSIYDMKESKIVIRPKSPYGQEDFEIELISLVLKDKTTD